MSGCVSSRRGQKGFDFPRRLASVQWKTKEEQVFEGGIKCLVLDMLHWKCFLGIQREILSRRLVLRRIWIGF